MPKMTRILLSLPSGLLHLVMQALPAGQTRAEWIRQAIRERLQRETDNREEV